MPLNYSKWDALELSDDSDIEGHPNVDKRSLIRWKQRDIHEKREVRRQRIATLVAALVCNAVLLPRLQGLRAALAAASAPLAMLNETCARLQEAPSPDKPANAAPGQPTYDEMVLSLLLQIGERARAVGKEREGADAEERMAREVVSALEEHIGKLKEEQERLGKELEEEEREQKKHITSEDIHEGWESKYVPPIPEPAPIRGAIPDTTKGKRKEKQTVTTFETINAAPSSSAATPTAAASTSISTHPPPLPSVSDDDEDDDDDDDDDESAEAADLPELTPGLALFARVPVGAYSDAWALVQQHRDIVVPGAYDALLVAAFRAAHDGNKEAARRAVHAGLLLQYAEKLGRDGVRVFFHKMIAADPRAVSVFTADVDTTYTHVLTRAAAARAEEGAANSASAGVEQIQLVPETPGAAITFNVPDGPPPPTLALADIDLSSAGPELQAADIDPEEVRRALQARWDAFSALPVKLQKALRSGSLEKVNKVLGGMSVEEAENAVGVLDAVGILGFSEHGVRDETGKGEADEAEVAEVAA